jgi:multicomponent Na+:H+ antiporter subunit D
VLVSSLLAVVYIWKVVEVAYFRTPSSEILAKAQGQREAPLVMVILLWLFVAANFYFGIDSSLPLSLAEMEAGMLIGADK